MIEVAPWPERWGRRTAAALLPLLLAACGTAEPGPKARPAMWLVADADTRIYILGTMHALPRGTEWDAGRVATAIETSDELMMELSPAELAAAGEMFRTLAPRDTPLAIEARLSGKALTGFRALETSGRNFGEDGLDDWAVMVLMGQRVAQNAGLSSADGVETGLTEKFKTAGKPVGGFETAREQLMLFETLDPQTQRILLTRAAEEAGDAVKEVGALTAAWGRGARKGNQRGHRQRARGAQSDYHRPQPPLERMDQAADSAAGDRARGGGRRASGRLRRRAGFGRG